MKKFICKITSLSVAFVLFNVIVLFAVPKDENAYLCEYNKKIELLETTKQPRMIFIGGSNLAFSIDSKAISDSLRYNVVNFGLHAGMGIRYPLEDCLQYIRKGDIAVLQFEYANFYSGGNGEMETFTSLMMSTNWRNADKLNAKQLINVITGIPFFACGNIKRLIKYPIVGSFDTPSVSPKNKYVYNLKGFNEYGDEVGHFGYKNKKYNQNKKETRGINKDFIYWLKEIIMQYEQAGAHVVILPLVCIKSHFHNVYSDDIANTLKGIGSPYIVNPSSMVLSDSCMFDTGSHMNRAGCDQNTQNIIKNLDYLSNL